MSRQIKEEKQLFPSVSSPLASDDDETKKQDPLVVAEYVDVIQYWTTVGAREYPCIADIALIYSCIPDSNAFQERVFSRCTYHATKLTRSRSTR